MADPVAGAKTAAKNAPPRGYYVPNFGMDQDIVDAQSNIKLLEKAHGAWSPVRDGAGGFVMPALAPGSSQSHNGHHFLQLDADIKTQDDPVCNSWKCSQYQYPHEDEEYKKDYKVADFGVDSDIVGTFNSMKDAGRMLNHKWIMGTKESKA